MNTKSILSKKVKKKKDSLVVSSAGSEIYKKQVVEQEQDDIYEIEPISLTTVLGGFFLIGSFGIAIAIASLMKIPVSVKSQVQIRPQGELKIVQSSIEGRVKDILVEENQSVKTGNIIATLEDSHLQTQKSQQENSLKQSQAELLQIKSTLNRHKIALETEKIRVERTIDSLKAELEEIVQNHQNKDLVATLQVEEASANLNSALEELQISQLELESVRAELKSSQLALDAATFKLSQYEKIGELGVISQERVRDTRLKVNQAKQKYQVQQSRLKTQEKIINQKQQNINLVKARLKQVEATLNPTHAPILVQKKIIAQEIARGKITLIDLQKEEDRLVQQIIHFQQKINYDRQELQKIEQSLAQTIVRSPVDGILFNLNLRNIGQNLDTGDTIARIAPDKTPLIIKGLVRNSDINRVELGQSVKIKIFACPYPDYGVLKGKVIEISPDTIASDTQVINSEAKLKTNQQFYKVNVQPVVNSFGKHGKLCTLQLGMEGKADIISREETIMKLILRKARIMTDL